ncbi:E3 ubiquitin-protein ligase TRIM35 isoform X2 [Sceloporus undulatus]|uniref:E3 ubiquitin-protein ligase TRIM35 isoform X2 n=1 Tax=Sceloporus undulatus TaxID=8520 RepID=UPI001C4D4D76|nr:E3 ubiquitin-protein ligase TRIM35 isoform X2 [Sceloporus undulatus]
MAGYFQGDLARSPRPRRARSCCRRCLPAPGSASPSKAMAKQGPLPSAPSLPTATIKEELLCPICYEPFKDAATLSCGHNFCKGCVSRSWEGQSRHVCPVCKVPCSPEDLHTNHTLANIVEMFLRQEKKQQQQQQRNGEVSSSLCPLHQEEAKLFCLDDKELVCFECQSAKHHADHKMKPVAEVAKTYRAKCKDMENSLRDKVKDFGRMQSDYRLIANHNKAESGKLEKEIKKQFEELHDFLRREERAMLEELREETQKKQELIEDKIKKLSEESDVLLQEVVQLQDDMKDDDISFLKKHKSRKRRIAWTIEKPEAIPLGTLVEVTKYLDSLQYKVWKKMLDIIKVVPFSFDPNTSTSWLEVSDDLTSISTCNYKLMVEVPERFSTGRPCVLGSRSYSSGPHAWEVDMGDNEYWYVGVARKSGGYYWSIGCDSRLGFGSMYRVQGTGNKKSLCSKSVLSETGRRKGIKRVRVELDCDEGELSFYDAEWRSHIYTFHDNFGEVFPYFSLCSVDTSESLNEPFKICPLQVLIKTDYPN